MPKKGCDSQVLKPMSQSMHQNDMGCQLGIWFLNSTLHIVNKISILQPTYMYKIFSGNFFHLFSVTVNI